MAGITLQLGDEFKSEIEHFSWVNWSAVAREEALKKEIFDRYIKVGELNDEDWEFCEKIDWHPVDWLPLKESFINDLKEVEKETPIKYNSVDEFFETIK